MSTEPSPKRLKISEIVPIVLHQVIKLRAEGALAQEAFDAQLRRLEKEELQPRGMTLLVRELADGQTRFLIKDKEGAVCEMIDGGLQGVSLVQS